MAARRVNMHYSARETVELVLNEDSDLEDFSDSGSEENIVDFGEEFVPVDLEADSRDSDNNIFIFIIGIRATSRIKNIFFTVFRQFPLCCWDRERNMIWCYGLLIWQVHIPSFLKMYMFIVLFLVVYLLQKKFKRAKTVRLHEPSVPFCGVLNELTKEVLYIVLLLLVRTA